MLRGQFQQGALFFDGNHPAGRIRGAVDDDHPGAAIDGGAQATEIEPVARAVARQWHGARFATGHKHRIRENRVSRRDDDRVVAPSDERADGGVDGHGGADGAHDL